MIDLRSDTVTHPSAAMRRAMMDAEVGDDVLDGDPTTARLEERVARLFGQEAALFFPSGTQANQTAVWVLSESGTEVLLEENAHLIHYELGALAALAGVQARPVTTTDGILTPSAARRGWRRASRFLPRISMMAAENTHNASGGRLLPLECWDGLVRLADERRVPIHLDGARIWHAAVAADIPLERLTRGATTVMVSFSKGLGCPVGSCLVGGRDVLGRAWEIRKRLGGGMRQTGILAAACLYALDHHVERLEEDHRLARLLAHRLTDNEFVSAREPETNILMLELTGEMGSADAVSQLDAAGVRVVEFGSRTLRAVMHLDVAKDDVEQAADTIARVVDR